MPQEQCTSDETVLRAVRTSDWDEKNNRWSSDLFRGPRTSVSRLQILSRKRIQSIFCKELERPPEHRVIQTAEISVGKIKDIGTSFTSNRKPDAREIYVYPAPTNINSSHAEIDQNNGARLPRGLAKKIINTAEFKKTPQCGKLQKKILAGVAVVLIIAAVSIALVANVL